MASILAFFSAVLELLNVFKQIFLLYRQAKAEGWITEGQVIANKISNAKTDEERRELVKALANHAALLP